MVYPLNLPDIPYSVFCSSKDALFRYSVRTLSKMKARSAIRGHSDPAKLELRVHDAQQLSTNELKKCQMEIKITDLGMAKSLVSDGIPSCSSSPARMQGTLGYFAPEYAIVGRASLMSDVFSFGVVLLELISGVVIWVTPLLQYSRIVSKQLSDPRLKGKFEEEEMQVMAYLAKECLLLDPDARPTMSEVVQLLLTIAPEKSKRRNFSVDFEFVSVKSFFLRSEKNLNFLNRIIPLEWNASFNNCHPVESSLLVHTPHENKEPVAVTGPDSHGGDDEVTVDLTEPHFESFCVSNISSAS
ncbi:unnamed protein product [Lactuca saligna]|uniref:Protein kinase domain-containing protein n=1 Tax=Lactuca saligna TaxID=75948 RepID=A0AA35VXH2_LACSI|nr:unnamed protein product [Lactuca saligna]